MDQPDKIRKITEDTSSLLLNPRFLGPVLAGVFCLIVATVVNVAYLFTIASILLALPVASYTLGSMVLKRCTSERDKAANVVQGESASVRLVIRTPHDLTPETLSVKDRLPRSVVSSDPVNVEVTEGKSEIDLNFTALKRGRFAIGPAIIQISDPLGMFRMRRYLQGTTELLVYPKPVWFKLPQMARGREESELNVPSGKLSNQGNFAGVREYRQGDELRRIHWKTTARTQELSIIELEDSTSGTISILVDLTKGADFGTGHITSVDVALGAAAYAIKQYQRLGHSVRLVLPGSGGIHTVAIHGPRDTQAALTALADAKADADMSLKSVINSAFTYGTLLLIATKPTPELASTVHDLVLRGSPVAVAIVDPRPFGGTDDVHQAMARLQRAGAAVELVREVDVR